MSFPNIPNIKSEIRLDRDDVINLLLASIALEELGLAHIINAEAEKIQYSIQLLNSQKMNNTNFLYNTLKINQSIHTTLKTVIMKEILLQLKLEETLQIIEEEDEDDEG